MLSAICVAIAGLDGTGKAGVLDELGGGVEALDWILDDDKTLEDDTGIVNLIIDEDTLQLAPLQAATEKSPDLLIVILFTPAETDVSPSVFQLCIR